MATNAMSLMPGRNPAGTAVAGDYSIVPGIGSTSGQNPILSPANIPSGAPQSNPYAPSSVVPTSGTGVSPMGGTSSASPYPTSGPGLITSGGAGPNAPGGQVGSGVGSMSGMSQNEMNQMLAELSKTYGAGTAGAIMSFLSGGAGYNQQALNNMLASLQPGIASGTESVMQQFSTMGDRFGSDAQLGLASYLSGVNLNEGQLSSQMYEQSINDYINVLMGAGSANASRISGNKSTWDDITSGLDLASSVTGGIDNATGGGGGNPILGGLMSVIESL